MSLEFENMDDFEPEKTQSMELEEYGVWVKKETPEIVDNILSDDDIFNPDYFQEMIENSPQEQETEIVEKTVDNLVDIPTDSPVLNNLETDNPEIPDIPAESTDTILDEISSDAQVNANDFDIENLASEIDGLDLSAFENQFEEKVIDAKNDEIKDNQEFIEETKNKSFDELPAGFDIPDLSNLTEEIDLSSFMSDFEASIPTPTPKPSSGGTEEVSLDDFGIDFSNSEFVSLDDFITPTEEKNDIIGDEPLDIQLTFDDNYALSTGANPLDEMETEFTEGFLPTGDDILDNFDDIFENVTDIAEPEIKVEETVSDFTTSETVEFDSVSEFDDLLASLSETSESSENIVEKQKENTETYQYDISVNLEEDEIIQDSTPEIDDNEEDFNVSLFSDEEFDNITSTQSANKIQGENTVEVSPMTNNNDSFFSIDDLDDSISFVDETPMDIDGIPVIDETPISDSPSNIEDSDILADDIGLPPLDDNFFASTEELSEPIFPIETTFFDGDNPVFAEEEVVQETEPVFTEEVATQTDDVFAMDDAFVSEPAFAEEEAVEETEPTFTEEVATQTDDAFAMDDAFVSEPAFAEEEAVQEIEPTFTEEVATQTDDAFAMDDAFVSEPVFAEEEAVQETEPVFTEEVATQTDDAFAMDDAFVSEPTFAEEEPVQETEPAFTEEDDPFAVDEEQEVNESFLEEDVLEEEKDFAIEEALPTVASITAAALLAGATINSVSPFQNEYEMDTTENVDKTPEMEYNESISPKEDTESMNENETSIDNMGNSLLEKIVNELSELRSEMASLKQELNTIKSTSEEQEKQVEEEIISIPESQSTGFFADDGEDETIALSGDELNNILNSADFTEEIVDESTVQEEITPESNISETEEMIENEVIENEITEESDSEEIAIEEEDLISDDLSIDDSIIEENTIESQIEIQDADINQENEEIIIENDDDDEIQPDEILSVTDETFYDDDNSPALDISNEEIVEPELCNINFEDETENDIPQELPEEELADDFVVDSSTTDFLEENSTNSTDVVQEEMELVEDGNIEEKVAEVENDDILNALDEEDDFNDEPATEVFNSQWDSLDISSEDETDSQENDNPIAITMEELANARMLAENQENEPVAPVVSEEVVSEKPASTVDNLSEDLKQDVKSVLEYMDKLLINLPEEKIKEFAASDHFEVYRKLFSELGLE